MAVSFQQRTNDIVFANLMSNMGRSQCKFALKVVVRQA